MVLSAFSERFASSVAAQTAAPEGKPARSPRKERVWFAILVLTALMLGAALFFLAPQGFWSKLSAIGYSVCHQIPERSFFAHTHQFPLCARCTGMYLGALLSLLFHFFRGRQSEFPPPALLAVLAFAPAANATLLFGQNGSGTYNAYETISGSYTWDQARVDAMTRSFPGGWGVPAVPGSKQR